jgi:hypothetical protein
LSHRVTAAATRAALVVALLVGAGCGGGGHGGGGVPTGLPLPGAGTIPVSEVTAAATQMCAVVQQSHQDAATVLRPFYAGPHDALHLLAAVALARHPAQAQNLLDVMLTYEKAIAAQPPPPETGADADALLQGVDSTLVALGVPAPGC